MALVDVGIRGLEFEVPDEWSESQVTSATRDRYPFLFPDLVARAGTSPEALRAADTRGILPPEIFEAARPPTIDEFQPGPITIAPNALRPPETPLPVDAGPALSPTGRPLDAAQLAFQDRFPQSRPPRPDEPGGQPNIIEALAKEYLRTVSGAAPTAIESIRMFQNAFGPGMMTDVLRNPAENLTSPVERAALRTEAARLDPIYTAAREFRQATQDAYDYNREALPAWQQKPAEWIGGGAGSATTFIPAALLGPAGVFGMSAAQTFSPSYEESRAAGATPKQALQQAIIASAAEALSEYVLGVPGQLSRLMGKKAPAKESIEKAIKEAVESRWKTAAKTVPREAIEEPISGAVQDISAAEITGADPSKGLTGKDKRGTPNWQSFLKRRVDDLMGGAVGGAVFIPAVRSAQQQSAMQLAEAKGAGLDSGPFRTAMRKAALKDEVWRTRAETDAAKGLPPRESTLADDLFAIGQRMEKAGFDDLEIQNSIDDTLNRISAARAAEQEPPTAPPVTGTDWTEASFRKALRAASIPKDVTVEFNTTEAKLVPGPDGDYRLPGQWDGKRIVVWTPNIRSFAHMVAVLKEENNHRIVGTEPGQVALRGFLVQHPLTSVLTSSPAWLREELAKYEGQGDAVITEEFIAKLGAEPSWKQWVAQARIFFKKLFGRELTAEEAARVLLRQLQQGKFSVAPVTPTPVTPPAAEVPSAPPAPISPPTTPTGAPTVTAAAPAPTEIAAAPVTPAAAPSSPAPPAPDKETPPAAPTSQPGAAVGVVAPPAPSEPAPTPRKVAEEVVKPPAEPPEWVADELGKLDALLEKAAKGPAVPPGEQPQPGPAPVRGLVETGKITTDDEFYAQRVRLAELRETEARARNDRVRLETEARLDAKKAKANRARQRELVKATEDAVAEANRIYTRLVEYSDNSERPLLVSIDGRSVDFPSRGAAEAQIEKWTAAGEGKWYDFDIEKKGPKQFDATYRWKRTPAPAAPPTTVLAPEPSALPATPARKPAAKPSPYAPAKGESVDDAASRIASLETTAALDKALKAAGLDTKGGTKKDKAKKLVERAMAVPAPTPTPTPAATPKAPTELTAAEINKRLDRLDKLDAQLTDEFIAAGRGNETPSDYLKLNDPLSTRARQLFDERASLRAEIEQRYGPGAPSRLPTRGFGPRYSIGDRVTTTISGTEQTLAPEQALKRARGLEYTLSRLADCLGKS